MFKLLNKIECFASMWHFIFEYWELDKPESFMVNNGIFHAMFWNVSFSRQLQHLGWASVELGCGHYCQRQLNAVALRFQFLLYIPCQSHLTHNLCLFVIPVLQNSNERDGKLCTANESRQSISLFTTNQLVSPTENDCVWHHFYIAKTSFLHKMYSFIIMKNYNCYSWNYYYYN